MIPGLRSLGLAHPGLLSAAPTALVELPNPKYYWQRKNRCRDMLDRVILRSMSTIVEVEKLALDLPERERAALAANLLESLPGILSDEDEGVAEALRRDAEIEADAAKAVSLRELDSDIQGRRG